MGPECLKDNEIAVDIQNVTKMFGDFTALNGVSLDIRDNEFFTLLGPSGCGKTTTLRLIAGLEMVSAGSIFIDGKEVTRLSASDRDVSMVFPILRSLPSHDGDAERILWPGHEPNAKTGGKRKSNGGIRVSRTCRVW